MTPSPIYVPGTSDVELDAINRLLANLDARTPDNVLRSSYYDGKRAVRQVGSVIPPQYYRLGLALGWSGAAVDALARRCALQAFVWPDGDLDSLGYSQVRDDNLMMAELPTALTLSQIHGVAFLVSTEGGEGEPPALLHVRDALNGTGTWNPRTRRLSDFLSVTSRDKEGKPTGLTLYLPGSTVTCGRDGGAWSVQDRVDGHPWGLPVEVVAYKPRADRPFGYSRISRVVMGLHDAGLRVIIRMEGHADVYSYPEMWMLGADERVFKDANGNPKGAWQVVLGRIKGLPDDEDASNPRADVKQFPASSPEPHLKQLGAIARLFARETSLPDSALAITDYANPTSADGYVEAREELIAEAESATTAWSWPLRRAVARTLAIANDEPGVMAALSTMEPQWRSPLYLSAAAAADAGSKRLASVPWLAETSVGLELLGLTPQQIRLALAERRRAQGRLVLEGLAAQAPPTAARAG